VIDVSEDRELVWPVKRDELRTKKRGKLKATRIISIFFTSLILGFTYRSGKREVFSAKISSETGKAEGWFPQSLQIREGQSTFVEERERYSLFIVLKAPKMDGSEAFDLSASPFVLLSIPSFCSYHPQAPLSKHTH
jgi:hypothetical protein